MGLGIMWEELGCVWVCGVCSECEEVMRVMLTQTKLVTHHWYDITSSPHILTLPTSQVNSPNNPNATSMMSSGLGWWELMSCEC